MKRHYSDDDLKALADVFGIDTGDTFKPITDEEVEAKAEAIFPQAQREELTAKLCADLEDILRKGATE